MKEIFALGAACLAIAGNVPYIRDTVAGRIQPHAYTWFVWSIVSAITLSGQIVKGAGIGALPAAIAELFTIGIFFLALRYGFKATRTDTYFLVVALLGVIPWLLTKDPTLSVVIAVGIDLVAFVPTLQKTWRAPESETGALYGANVARHALALLSMQTYNVATTLHSIAMILMNTAMTAMIFFPTWRRSSRV